MSIQAYIGILYLVLVIIITAVFLVVWQSSKQKSQPESFMPRASRMGKVWLMLLLVISGALTLATIPLIHYPGVAAPLSEERQTVTVEALQFGWVFQPKQLKTGIPTEFKVTSRDVNHGLGVVDSNGVLLFQVQAMPKYTNRAVYTFEKPGTYRVICMEYCGLAHHLMITAFEVVP